MKKRCLLPAICFLLSCSGREQHGFAHIIQRRLESGGKLVISYRFTTGEKIIYDSLALVNRVIQQDSLPVVFSAENPAHNRLVLP